MGLLVSRRVTSQDVADAVGVSRTTVSLVLNNVQGVQISDETRQKVISTAKEMGYVPDAAARALASRKADTIGLILNRSPHHIISDSFLTQILNGLIEVAHRHGMRLMIDVVKPRHEKDDYLRLIRSKHIDGLILSGPRFDDEALQLLEEDGFPTVIIGNLPRSGHYSVDIDNRAAAVKAVNHLADLGHERIACITNADPTFTAAAERLQGYREALQARGIPYREDLVRYGDFDIKSGYDQMESLLDQGASFSAVFVASDAVAMGAKAALRHRGKRIPQDVAMVGFDDLAQSRFLDPPLTTIHVPAGELSRRASELLIGCLRGEKPPKRKLVLGTRLVVRQSCGARLT